MTLGRSLQGEWKHHLVLTGGQKIIYVADEMPNIRQFLSSAGGQEVQMTGDWTSKCSTQWGVTVRVADIWSALPQCWLLYKIMFLFILFQNTEPAVVTFNGWTQFHAADMLQSTCYPWRKHCAPTSLHAASLVRRTGGMKTSREDSFPWSSSKQPFILQ